MKDDCLKQRVYCIIQNGDKLSFGRNRINFTPNICPRLNMKSGEGYELCKNICKQENHAEIDAINNADFDLKGATLYLFGHTYCCDDCLKRMKEVGIDNVIIVSK